MPPLLRRVVSFCSRTTGWFLSKLPASMVGVIATGTVVVLGAAGFAVSVLSFSPEKVRSGWVESLAGIYLSFDLLSLVLFGVFMTMVGGVAGAQHQAWHKQRLYRRFLCAISLHVAAYVLLCLMFRRVVPRPVEWSVPLLGFLAVLVLAVLIGEGISGFALRRSAEAIEEKSSRRRRLLSLLRGGLVAAVLAGVIFAGQQIHKKLTTDPLLRSLPPKQAILQLLTCPIKDALMVAYSHNALRRSSEYAICLSSIDTIENLGSWRSTPVLMAITRRQNTGLRLHATCALARPRFARGPYVDQCRSTLIRLTRDPSPRVREAAALGLRHFPARKGVQALVGCLADPDIYVRLAAAASLAGMKSREVRGQLRETAETGDSPARVAVWVVLAVSGDKQAEAQLAGERRNLLSVEDERFPASLGFGKDRSVKVSSPPAEQSPERAVKGVDPVLGEWYYRQGQQLASLGTSALASLAYRQSVQSDPTRIDAKLAGCLADMATGAQPATDSQPPPPASLSTEEELMLAARVVEHSSAKLALKYLDHASGYPSSDSQDQRARDLLVSAVLKKQRRWKESEEWVAVLYSEWSDGWNQDEVLFTLGSVRWKLRRHGK